MAKRRGRSTTFRAMEKHYATLWETMHVKSRWKRYVSRDVKRILKGERRYKWLEGKTGVPWYMLGIIHLNETGCKWNRHWHNGNSLRRRTTWVPKNRPRTHHGPFTWQESALDAVTKSPHNLKRISNWSVPRMLYELERYNGMAYWKWHHMNSPYIWSGTMHYRKGKYVSDGKWSSSAVSKQLGAAPVLAALMEHDKRTRKGRPARHEVPTARIVQASSKLRTTVRVQKGLAAGGGVLASLSSADSLGMLSEKLETVKGFLADNQSTLIVVLLCAGLIYTWYIKKKSIEDFRQGRYEPSGLHTDGVFNGDESEPDTLYDDEGMDDTPSDDRDPEDFAKAYED